MHDDLEPTPATAPLPSADQLFAASPDGMLVVDGDGVICVANGAAAAVFGWSIAELVGSSVDKLVPTEHRSRHAEYRARYEAAPDQRPMGSGLRLLAEGSGGRLFPVEISLSPVEVAGDRYTIATVRDVTERQEQAAHLALLEDRERIARDLHDVVIQRILAAGMTLQATGGLVENPAVRPRIDAVVDELDRAIDELRAAIFQLGSSEKERALANRIRHLVDERADVLGFQPEVHVDESVNGLPERIAEQMVATVTEALSNVVRHADASEVSVEIVRDDVGVRLTVTDDGCGIGDHPKAGGGVKNMMWRAAELGGTCNVRSIHPVGTQLVWQVPV